MLKSVFFDLDDTLYPTATIGISTYRPVIERIRAHLPGASAPAVDAIFNDFYSLSLSQFMRRHTGYGGMARDCVASLEFISPPGIEPFKDIGALKEIDALRFLVTAGNRAFQMKKVRALGIEGLFHGIFIDDVLNATGKKPIFEEIMRRYSLKSGEVLVVGDNPESEIKAGNELGCVTVQVVRPGFVKGDNAGFYISDLHQLRAIVEEL